MSRIIFLYSELMPYIEAVIDSLAKDFNDEITVISWDKKVLTPYQPNLDKKVKYFPRSKVDTNEIVYIIKTTSPELIYVSGRMDRTYLAAIKKSKTKASVVMGMDTQLTSSAKQYIQVVFRKLLYSNHFNFVWVPGPRQYSYARLLGFPADKIIFNLLSGNNLLFERVRHSDAERKKVIFIGRLEKIKGLDLLLKAWDSIESDFKVNWELLLIGEGSLKSEALGRKDVVCKGFLSHSEMIEIISGDNIFCLPSRLEPWGVVVHEMAIAGIPMIVSNTAGSVDCFLINNYNGYLIKEVTINTLRTNILRMINLPYTERALMGMRSRELSNRVNPRIAAASFRSIL